LKGILGFESLSLRKILGTDPRFFFGRLPKSVKGAVC
jgi:hypothetical protein